MQGIKAVLAESYERIHRSNLVGMGVIPLEYLPGDTADSLGLTGREHYTVVIPELLTPRMVVDIKVRTDSTLLQACWDVTLTCSLPAPTARHGENIPSAPEI